MPTALTIITDAFKDLGYLGVEDTLLAPDAADGLARLNRLIDRWATQRLTMPVQLRTTKTLTAGQSAYTVGTGGDIAIVRPTGINRAAVILDLSSSIELPIDVLDQDGYAAVPDKSTTAATISGITYDYGYSTGLGTVTTYPVPTVSTIALVLYTPQALTAFADLVTAYTLPPGLEEALVANLAQRLSIPYGRPLAPELAEAAANSLGDYKRSNLEHQMTDLVSDAPLGARAADWGYLDFLRGRT